MADTKTSALTAATDLVSAELAGQQGGVSKRFGIALWNAIYQPLLATLTSWGAITRAAGFDTFVATPSSANLKTLVTDETGSSGALVFANAPTITGTPVFSGVPSLTGGALSFPTTQVPSAGVNDLDDYEEATFTPTVSFLTPGTSSFAYTTQEGVAIKIGKLVFIRVRVIFTPTIGTGSGTFSINGLPYTSASSPAFAPGEGAVGNLSSTFTWGAGFTQASLHATLGTTTFSIAINGSGVSGNNIQASNMTNSAAHTVVGTLVYEAAS